MNTKYFCVAQLTDLEEGAMKQVTVDGTDVLLVKVEGRYFAVGATCTHYGAPLAKGALCGKHVICPWHHAQFDVTNGNLLEPPALDALPHYEIEIRDQEVFVGLPIERSDRRTPTMASCDGKSDQRIFTVLGGGAAGYAAAQTLREDGFCGRIVMITQETELPYDRTNLSKDYLQGELNDDEMPLRPVAFYETHRIEVLKGRSVEIVNHADKEIIFEGGDTFTYDKLLVATGGTPNKLKVPGAELDNIFLLRSLDSADAIIKSAKNAKKVVVIGASFIGMEAAASLQSRGLSVTVVAPDELPFEKTLGPQIGSYFKKLHEENGVNFKMSAKIASFDGNSSVEAVVLESGERLNADVVLTGIGVTPATDLLKGIERQKDGGILTNQYLEVTDGLYVAGDIAAVPHPRSYEPVRIEHWRYALQQGRNAAQNMLGKNVPFTSVPFFWTAHFGVSLRYLGHAKRWDEIFYDGNVDEKKFLAFYLENDRIMAVAGIGRDKAMAHLEELFKENQLPSATDLKTLGVKHAFGDWIIE